MAHELKLFLYWFCKLTGLFRVARFITGSGLRILCYHGFTLRDEHLFRPSLFITRDQFERRLRYLSESGFPVLPLTAALERLDRGTLPSCATVITIDDGFYGVYVSAKDGFAKYGFSSTLYLTTYYFRKQTPIYRLVVSYFLWKAARRPVDLSGIGVPDLANSRGVDLTRDERLRLERIIIDYGEAHCDEKERGDICAALGRALGLDYDDMVRSRIMSLVNENELKALTRIGMEVQLHTHRHRFPEDNRVASQEIADNRASVPSWLRQPMRHLCYPSGVWHPSNFATLQAAGVESAMTCEPGLAYRDSPRLALRRILDSSQMSQIEFEAEMCGVGELLRQLRARLRRARGIPSAPLQGSAPA
jgi:peptidoglycan/xylan/chitin deacetylase (PgdA/CDA1 family)